MHDNKPQERAYIMEQKKVLVVEDNRALLELIGKFLMASGWEVSLARGAPECWERLKQFHPRVILLDMLLSEGSGFEIAQSLKKMRSYREIPILAMTGLYARHEVKKCLLAGCNDVLLKPFRFVVLDKILTALADRAAPRAEASVVDDGSKARAAPSEHLLH
jgi:CheY-like chemotaxis protein